MFMRLRPTPARIGSLDAEADALIKELGVGAYSEARRREREASCDAIARDWSHVAMKVAQLAGGLIDLDASSVPGLGASPETREAPDGREQPLPQRTEPFRIQFIRLSPLRSALLLDEVQIEASDTSAAIVAAACSAWPPQTQELRILDRDGRQVFARRANGRQPSPA
jgi:hypothetical protein